MKFIDKARRFLHLPPKTRVLAVGTDFEYKISDATKEDDEIISLRFTVDLSANQTDFIMSDKETHIVNIGHIIKKTVEDYVSGCET